MNDFLSKLIDFTLNRVVGSWRSTISGIILILFSFYSIYHKLLDSPFNIGLILIGVYLFCLDEYKTLMPPKSSN